MAPNRLQRMLLRLQTVVDRVRVLYVVRNPLSFLESAYFFVLRQFNLYSGHENSAQIEGLGDPPRIFSFREWFEIQWKRPGYGFIAGLRGHDLVCTIEKVLGPGSVGVFPYETFQEAPDRF